MAAGQTKRQQLPSLGAWPDLIGSDLCVGAKVREGGLSLIWHSQCVPPRRIGHCPDPGWMVGCWRRRALGGEGQRRRGTLGGGTKHLGGGTHHEKKA
eukprot:8162970-Pyramimonas_sp.AAC.1